MLGSMRKNTRRPRPYLILSLQRFASTATHSTASGTIRSSQTSNELQFGNLLLSASLRGMAAGLVVLGMLGVITVAWRGQTPVQDARILFTGHPEVQGCAVPPERG